MTDEKHSSHAAQQSFGEMIHSADQKNPMALGFGSCCCSCSSSAAVFVEECTN